MHPDFYKPQTATGEALRAHELYHVWQRSIDPDFANKFARVADEIEAAGKQPWDNPYEKPAYEFEESVKQYLLGKGYKE